MSAANDVALPAVNKIAPRWTGRQGDHVPEHGQSVPTSFPGWKTRGAPRGGGRLAPGARWVDHRRKGQGKCSIPCSSTAESVVAMSSCDQTHRKSVASGSTAAMTPWNARCDGCSPASRSGRRRVRPRRIGTPSRLQASTVDACAPPANARVRRLPGFRPSTPLLPLPQGVSPARAARQFLGQRCWCCGWGGRRRPDVGPWHRIVGGVGPDAAPLEQGGVATQPLASAVRFRFVGQRVRLAFRTPAVAMRVGHSSCGRARHEHRPGQPVSPARRAAQEWQRLGWIVINQAMGHYAERLRQRGHVAHATGGAAGSSQYPRPACQAFGGYVRPGRRGLWRKQSTETVRRPRGRRRQPGNLATESMISTSRARPRRWSSVKSP